MYFIRERIDKTCLHFLFESMILLLYTDGVSSLRDDDRFRKTNSIGLFGFVIPIERRESYKICL